MPSGRKQHERHPEGAAPLQTALGLFASEAVQRYTLPFTSFGRTAMGRKKQRLHGRVNRLIKSVDPSKPEKAEIAIEEAEELYREIRIDNVVTGEDGTKASLKPGADVDVIVEADSSASTKKPA